MDDGPFDTFHQLEGVVISVERNPIPHLSDGQDGFNGAAAVVPILLGAKGLNVFAYGFNDFAISGEHGPVCKVEGEIAILMGPTGPNVLVFTKSLKGVSD